MSLQFYRDLPAAMDAGSNVVPMISTMISIVDDDESVREATKELVSALGYGAVTFGSAEEFLSSDQIDHTCCLITDLQMTGINGIELQTRLVSEGRRVPVIFITAFPDEKMRRRALDAGAIGFLSKPFTDDSLIQCLDRAIANYRSGSEDQ